MEIGTITLYNVKRGIGSIRSNMDYSGIFFHIKGVADDQLRINLRRGIAGQTVNFSREINDRGPIARQIKPIPLPVVVRPLLVLNDATSLLGTVKWFNATKGYGFIERDDRGKDVFVHISAVLDARLPTLQGGQRVRFHIKQQPDGRQAAVDLSLT